MSVILDLFKEEKTIVDRTDRFYKENGVWYIDLPQFLEAGLGTRANLMMVAGADQMLDKLSGNTSEVKLRYSNHGFREHQEVIQRTSLGHDEDYLKTVGHAPVDGGAYYHAMYMNQPLWLCPVTKYVFDGYYPLVIYLQVV
jgi:hypothetical protein